MTGMTTFILDRSFDKDGRANGLRREKVGIVATRYGPVLAYENNGKSPVTVCPGLYDKELEPVNTVTKEEVMLAIGLDLKPPPPRFCRAMSLFAIPEEWRPGVKEDLEIEGYNCTKIMW